MQVREIMKRSVVPPLWSSVCRKASPLVTPWVILQQVNQSTVWRDRYRDRQPWNTRGRNLLAFSSTLAGHFMFLLVVVFFLNLCSRSSYAAGLVVFTLLLFRSAQQFWSWVRFTWVGANATTARVFSTKTTSPRPPLQTSVCRLRCGSFAI